MLCSRRLSLRLWLLRLGGCRLPISFGLRRFSVLLWRWLTRWWLVVRGVSLSGSLVVGRCGLRRCRR